MKIKAFNKQEITQAIATNLIIEMLGDKIEPFTSICENSIPTAGSPAAPLNKLDQDELFKQMTDIVFHNTGDFTVKTDAVNIRFWIKTDYALLWLAHNNIKQTMNRIVNNKYDCGDLY